MASKQSAREAIDAAQELPPEIAAQVVDRWTAPVAGTYQMDSDGITLLEADPPAEPDPIPVPTAYRLDWFPAAVRLPDVLQPLQPVKVFATRQGLYVYNVVPLHQDTGMEPVFFSPIDYDKTPRPRTGYAAQQVGAQIVTAAGVVIVQQLPGCGCAHQALKAWRPTWAQRNEAWEA